MIGAVYIATNIFINKETSFIQITSSGIQNIKLSDGTTVTLDAGSSFKYPENFSGLSKREVYLNGEGYFEVYKNKNAPFVVHANNGSITVLGTKFNVRAWKQNRNVVVAVEEGKVSLRDNLNAGSNGVILTNGKMSVLSEDGAITTPEEVNIPGYLSWLKREMSFTDTPLSDILNQLERWYNIKIELKDPALLNNRITVFIENKPIDENIKLICTLLNLKYSINNNTVKLYPVEQ